MVPIIPLGKNDKGKNDNDKNPNKQKLFLNQYNICII